MTFRELLSGLTGQRVLVNADSFKGRYAVGEFITLGDDFISIAFQCEAVHYPISRVLEVSTARGGSCHRLVDPATESPAVSARTNVAYKDLNEPSRRMILVRALLLQ